MKVNYPVSIVSHCALTTVAIWVCGFDIASV